MSSIIAIIGLFAAWIASMIAGVSFAQKRKAERQRDDAQCNLYEAEKRIKQHELRQKIEDDIVTTSTNDVREQVAQIQP